MKTYIKNGKIIIQGGEVKNNTLLIENNMIVDIIDGKYSAGEKDKVIDARGLWVSPGLIDIHTHGAIGNGAMDATVDAIHTMAKYYASHGVTSYLPTTWSASKEVIQKAIDNIKTCPQPRDGSRHLGVHIEGPYLDVDNRGAQLKSLIRLPDMEEYDKWMDTGIVRLITIAPEVEGAIEFIDKAVKCGVEFSIGHSGATYEQVINAADHGVKQATHLYNGMVGLHHRAPGTAGGILMEDRIYAQIIADGVHVHPVMINLALRAKSIDRIILITDSIRGTGLPDGEYDQHGQRFTVKDGVARTPEGGLSGSTLTLDQAVRNMVKFTNLPFNDVVQMATSVPAEAMGWSYKRGVIKPGADADLAFFNDELMVEKTIVLGREVYSK